MNPEQTSQGRFISPVEIVIVLVIMALLAGIFVPPLIRSRNEAEKQNAAIEVVKRWSGDINPATVKLMGAGEESGYIVSFRYKGEPTSYPEHAAVVKNGKVELVDGEPPRSPLAQVTITTPSTELPKQPIPPPYNGPKPDPYNMRGKPFPQEVKPPGPSVLTK